MTVSANRYGLWGWTMRMVETDAPYLTPMPYRGRTNAPYMIPYTLRAMADTLDLPIADVARGTRDTARAVYGL